MNTQCKKKNTSGRSICPPFGKKGEEGSRRRVADAGTARGAAAGSGGSDPPVRHQVSGLLLVNVWHYAVRCLYHFNCRLAEKLALVVYQLPPEADVGPDDGPPGFHPVVGLQQAHAVELHQVRDAERGRAADPRGTVHQGGPMFAAHAVDLVGHGVKVQSNGGVGHVGQRHFNIFKLGPVEIGDLNGSVHNAGDASSLEEVPVGGDAASAQEERGGDLRNASQVSLRNHPGGHESPGECAVTSGAHEDASNHTCIVGSKTRGGWFSSTKESEVTVAFLQDTVSVSILNATD